VRKARYAALLKRGCDSEDFDGRTELLSFCHNDGLARAPGGKEFVCVGDALPVARDLLLLLSLLLLARRGERLRLAWCLEPVLAG